VSEALSAADCGVEWDHKSLVVVGWAVATTAALVGPVSVEVFGVQGQYRGRVPFVVDQHPVGALGADRAYEPLGIPVRGGKPGRAASDLHTLGREHGIEVFGELATAVADQVCECGGALAEVGL